MTFIFPNQPLWVDPYWPHIPMGERSRPADSGLVQTSTTFGTLELSDDAKAEITRLEDRVKALAEEHGSDQVATASRRMELGSKLRSLELRADKAKEPELRLRRTVCTLAAAVAGLAARVIGGGQ